MRFARAAAVGAICILGACAGTGGYGHVSPSRLYGMQLGRCDNIENAVDRQNCRDRARDDYEAAKRIGIPDVPAQAAGPQGPYLQTLKEMQQRQMYMNMLGIAAGLLNPPRYYSPPQQRTIYCDPEPLVGGELACR